MGIGGELSCKPIQIPRKCWEFINRDLTQVFFLHNQSEAKLSKGL